MKAIVYESNAGHTKAYAEMLGKKLNLPVYSLKESKSVENKADIIYMGWLMGGTVSGLKKAAEKFNVKAVSMTGMAAEEDLQNDVEKVNSMYGIDKNSIFILRGGFELSKLKGIFKFMMGAMSKNVCKDIQNKTERTDKDNQTYEMFTKGMNLVDEKNLDKIVEWYSKI